MKQPPNLHPSGDPLSVVATGLVPDLGNAMRSFGADTAKDLLEDLPDPASPAQVKAAALEGMIFFLHLLDRTAFERFGPFKRRVFMDAILEDVSGISAFAGLPSTAFHDLWNARQNEYSAFPKLYPENSESWKGTLCWEFAKRMGAEYGNGNPARITLIASGGLSVIEMFRKVLSTIKA